VLTNLKIQCRLARIGYGDGKITSAPRTTATMNVLRRYPLVKGWRRPAMGMDEKTSSVED
jgi:hypothetical protein